ncbi:hypothetical protein [Thermococcus sp. JdF3]|uniref:hypothetical protein n=1 Tax=Thermococcus sp. JdF3 TaxID=1638258 RepID=UPI00143B82BC|nr:hypothetical protein [Thermococcus sp. JdF3]NJE01896.1 hypothetical protein [Thermococcus sp. JdF3]
MFTFKLEMNRLKGKPALVFLTALVLSPFLGDVLPVVPYFLIGFLFSALFPRSISNNLELLLSKPLKRSSIYLDFFLSHLVLATLLVLPFTFLEEVSALYALFALPFLPMGYITALLTRDPRKTAVVGVLMFLLLTFVPPGFIQLKAQDTAQQVLGVHSLEDYGAKRTEYSALVSQIERRYASYAFFSPGAQLELFARDVSIGAIGDALLRVALVLSFFTVLTLVSLALFIRLEPGAILRPSPPSLYLGFLPWWLRKELANLWAMRTFPALLALAVLPLDPPLRGFFLLFLLPLTAIDILSENPTLVLSKPVGRDYVILRFLIAVSLSLFLVPFVGYSFSVAFFLSALVFLLALFTRKGAMIFLPVLALLLAPAIGEASFALTAVFVLLSAPVLLLARLRLSKMDFSGWYSR